MIKKKWLIYCSLIFVFWGVNSKSPKRSNRLLKAFHYVGRASKLSQNEQNEQDVSIDLGKIVLVFSPQRPVVNLLPSTQQSNEEKRDSFFFPLSTIESSESKKMVKALNKIRDKNYKFHLEQVQKPMPGLQLSISYDPRKVSLDYSFFNTIRANKGVVFRFYNKDVLNLIEKSQRSLVRVASRKKKINYCRLRPWRI